MAVSMQLSTSSVVSQHEFNRDVALWFVGVQAFDNVEKEGFVDFFKKHFPGADLPRAKTLAGTALNDLYVAVLSKVKAELASVCAMCVTADGWTDRYHGRAYIVVRVSFFKDWEYKIITLSCVAIPGSHTGQALADHIKGVLSAFFPDTKKC